MSTYLHNRNLCEWDYLDLYLGVDDGIQLAQNRDEQADEDEWREFCNSFSRANQSQSPDRGADVFGSDSETTHVSETDDDEPLSPEIPIKHTPVKPPPAPEPPPPPVKPVPVPGPVLTRRVRKRNLPKPFWPVVSKEARIALDERRRRRLEKSNI